MKLMAVLLLSITLWASGCPPKGAYHDAVTAEHDFAQVVQHFQQAEIQEHTDGRIDDATHQKIEAGVEKVGLAAQTLVTSLQSGASNTTVKQNFDTVAAALNTLLDDGVLGIKNPNSVLLLKTLISTAQAILKNVGSLLSIQPTVTISQAGTCLTETVLQASNNVACRQNLTFVPQGAL